MDSATNLQTVNNGGKLDVTDDSEERLAEFNRESLIALQT
jgi:hypothetical protein